MQPLVVELAGPAGCGKSALAERLSAQPGVIRASVWRLPWVLLFASAVRSLPALVGLCRATRSVSWILVSQVVRLNALRLLVRRYLRDARLVVLDEGPVFALSWLCVFGPPRLTNGAAEPWWRKRGAEWTRLIDRVVLLDAPDPILTGRIRGRRKRDDVFRDFTDRQITELAAAYRAAFAHVLRHLAPAGRVLTFSTEHTSVDQLADGLAAALEESRRGD